MFRLHRVEFVEDDEHCGVLRLVYSYNSGCPKCGDITDMSKVEIPFHKGWTMAETSSFLRHVNENCFNEHYHSKILKEKEKERHLGGECK